MTDCDSFRIANINKCCTPFIGFFGMWSNCWASGNTLLMAECSKVIKFLQSEGCGPRIESTCSLFNLYNIPFYWNIGEKIFNNLNRLFIISLSLSLSLFLRFQIELNP